MNKTIAITHAYSPEQYGRAVDLWERLIDCYHVALYKEIGRASMYLEKLEDGQIYELIMSDGEETRNHYPVTVNLVSYSDYGGSIFDNANVRALDNFSGVNTTSDGTHGAGSAWIQLGELPNECGEIDAGLLQLQKLVEVIESLSGDVASISESAYDEVMQELEESAWDAWAESDVKSSLGVLADGNVDDFGFSDDEIRELYYGYENNNWYADTATSVTNERHEDAVEHVCDVILSEWRKPWIDPNQTQLFAA